MSDSLLSELLTTEQLADLLQMTQSTVGDYARRGILPSVKIGRHRRFVLSDVEAAVERLRGVDRPAWPEHRAGESSQAPP